MILRNVLLVLLALAAGLCLSASGLSTGEVYVYPNPVNRDRAHAVIMVKLKRLDTLATTPAALRVIIRDRLGRVVWSRDIENSLTTGKNRIHWGLTNNRGVRVVRGVYYVRVYIMNDRTAYHHTRVVVR